jgi:catechol 2,3-dioxygenase-like lactoylglutathione lyase family enzyme
MSSLAGVHSIDHFALNVPSLQEADHFYRSFGLEVDGSSDELALRAQDGHRWARVLPAAGKSLAYLSFNCYAADLAQIERQARATGANFDVEMKALRGAAKEGIWFYDIDGNLLQVKPGVKTSPDAKLPLIQQQVAANTRGAVTRAEAPTVRPRRLSHVLLFTPDVARIVDFYNRALGLRLSDKSLDIIAFTHGPHGSDHHLVAFAKSSARGWHHVAWDVARIDDVGIGAAQMAKAGYKAGWGTGRHVLGSNYFHYVRDPWGSFSEYSADIDYVPAGAEWAAGDFLPEDSLYLWGPDVPEYFISNTDS